MRRALEQLLPEDHQSIEKRSRKRRDSNGRPKYQNVSFVFLGSPPFVIPFLRCAAQHIAPPAGGCFHLSLRTTGKGGTKFPDKLRSLNQITRMPASSADEFPNSIARHVHSTTRLIFRSIPNVSKRIPDNSDDQGIRDFQSFDRSGLKRKSCVRPKLGSPLFELTVPQWTVFSIAGNV
jgi:hypothetical protein